MKRALAAGLVIAVLGVIAAAVIVAVGRWEGRRQVAHELAEMQLVLAAVGPLDKAQPTGYRYGPPNCLAYPTAQNALGLQLCFDPAGRLVETVDRRSPQPVYASLNYDPALSTIREPPQLIARLLAATAKAADGD